MFNIVVISDSVVKIHDIHRMLISKGLLPLQYVAEVIQETSKNIGENGGYNH